MEEKSNNWRFGVAGNIVKRHTDESGTVRYGTKAFPGNSKVYIDGNTWDADTKTVTVLGRTRFKKYTVDRISVELIENVRCQRIYKPIILKIMDDLEMMDGWRWGKQTVQDRKNAERFVKIWRREKIHRFVSMLTGRRLNYFCCECDMFDLGFDGSLVLHVPGFGRIIKNDDILVTTFDYQTWDEAESTNNDEWYNMRRFNAEIVGGTVVSVKLSPINDLYITLDNGASIECFVSNSYPHYGDEREQWVLFQHKTAGGQYLTVYNKHAELD